MKKKKILFGKVSKAALPAAKGELWQVRGGSKVRAIINCSFSGGFYWLPRKSIKVFILSIHIIVQVLLP